MKRLLFLLFFLPIFAIGQNKVPPSTKSRGDYDQTLRARDTLFTDYHFVYRDTVIPVLDISYHEFSSDGNSWHKPWVEGDTYIRISNDVKNTWKVLNIIDIVDPLWARDSVGGIYNLNPGDVHIMNSLEVEDSINTNNFYFLDGDSLRITSLNARDGTSNQILTNINGVAYWMNPAFPDSLGLYFAQNVNIGGHGVFEEQNASYFLFRGVDVDSSFLAISLDNPTNRIVIAFDPTKLSVTAGIGLSGGGSFDASGNVIVNLSIPELTTATSYDSLDWFAMYDVSLASHRKVHISSITGGTPSTDSVFWIAANDGDIDTVFNYSPLFFEEGDSIIGIEVSGDSVIFTVNGCLVPPGGLAGQVLVKLSDADCDLAWVDFCDLIETCDNVPDPPDDAEAFMCAYCNMQIAYTDSLLGEMSVDSMYSTTCDITEYAIDWYMGDSLIFTSATAGAGLDDYVPMPFPDEFPISSGTYDPVIRFMISGGLKYTADGLSGIYSPDLADCLPSIYVAPYTCSNGGSYSGYTHQVDYYYTLSESEYSSRSVSFDLDPTTEYVPWYFYAEIVNDTIDVYYESNGVQTLLEHWTVGLDQANTDIGAGRWDYTTFYKIQDISTYTYSAGDRIVFNISPGGLNTNWVLRFMCRDSLVADVCDPYGEDYALVDTLNPPTVTWDSINCRYVVNFRMAKNLADANDILSYTMGTSQGSGGGGGTSVTTYANRNTLATWGNVGAVANGGSVGDGCEAFVDTIFVRKTDSIYSMQAKNSTDYDRLKVLWAQKEALHGTGYSTDPLNVNHYRLFSSGYTWRKITCPTDVPGTLITSGIYAFYEPGNMYTIDSTYTVAFKMVNKTNPFANLPCDNKYEAMEAQIAAVTNSIATADYETWFKYASYYWHGARYYSDVIANDSTTSYNSFTMKYDFSYNLCNETFDGCPITWTYAGHGKRRTFSVDIQYANDPSLGILNYRLYNNYAEDGCTALTGASRRLVYEVVGGVGTWHPENLLQE